MHDKTNGEQASLTLFKLLEYEGKFPLVQPQKGVYYFPLDKLEVSLIEYWIKFQRTMILIFNFFRYS